MTDIRQEVLSALNNSKANKYRLQYVTPHSIITDLLTYCGALENCSEDEIRPFVIEWVQKQQVDAEINELMAKALAGGYAKGILKLAEEYRLYVGEAMGSTMDVPVDPFADTLEGRRQADALEHYLYCNKYKLWADSPCELDTTCGYDSQHQWRLDRIRWCFEELAKKEM